MILGQHINKLDVAGWPTAINPKLIRVATLHWHQIETAPGVYDWTKADAIFSKIPAGTRVILANSGTPRFYSARPNEAGNAVFPIGTLAEPSDYGKFRAYLALLKQRYPAITQVEGPNEPGAGSGYCSSTMPAILDWQRAVWMEFSGSTKVISAPVVLTDSGFDTLAGLMATQGMDYIGVHFYSSTLDPAELDAAFYRVRQIVDRSGNKDKPIWVTEFGFNLPPYGVMRFPDLPVAVQIAVLKSHLPVLAKHAAASVFFAYDDPDYGFKGVTDTEIAWRAIQIALG